MMELPTLRRRVPTLSEVANTAAFIASDRVSAMTGTVVNLSGGKSSTSGTRGSPCVRPPSARRRRPGSARCSTSHGQASRSGRA